MRKTILTLLLTTLLSAAYAQDNIWMVSGDRFKTIDRLDLTDYDSIQVLPTRFWLWKDGKRNKVQTIGNYDYFSFHDPGLSLYCPKELQSNNWESTASKWCFQRSRESEHFIVFWESGFGLDPTKSSRMKFDPQDILDQAEKIYKVNTEKLGFATPGSSKTLDTYKHEIFVLYQTEWLATGSGYDDKIGALWCNPDAINSHSTIAHEIGHTFQYIVACDLGGQHGWRYGLGPNGEGGNMFWESCAQWQAYQVYPTQKFSDGWAGAYPSSAHLNLLHEEPRYSNYFFQDYWCQLFGQDFIGRLWRESKRPEDPVDTYKRITGRSQAEFCDDMFEYARRAVTWDIDALRTSGKTHRDWFTTRMHDTNMRGWLEVDARQCPENYGFNVIRLKKPNTQQVKALFRGIAGAEGYRQVNVDKAGWRYGFVALTTKDERVYSEIGRDSQGELTFDVPDNLKQLWFVVSGAPTEHFHHAWDDNTSNDEQWPYQVCFEGTDMQGHVIIDENFKPHDTTLTYDVTLPNNPESQDFGTLQIDMGEVCNALGVNLNAIDAMNAANVKTDTLTVLGVQADGTLSDLAGSNYAFAYYFDSEGNMSIDENAVQFYLMYTPYNNYTLYFVEVQEFMQPGQTYSYAIAFRRKASDGNVYVAKVVVNVRLEDQ